MKLSANPFHPVTNELLPAYRDAYLRDDLSGINMELVSRHLGKNAKVADATLVRFHELQHRGHDVRPAGWLHQQFELLRTEPRRFRQRAGTLVLGGLLAAGASLAAVSLPTAGSEPEAVVAGAAESTAIARPYVATVNALRATTVRGRIFNAAGEPLAGATVYDRASRRAVSTNAAGDYSLTLPANDATTLSFAYVGYDDQLLSVNQAAGQDVTLTPKAVAKKRHWWQF